MSKTKYLALSVVFAITYIACDLSYVFYVAGETETNTVATHNNAVHQYSYRNLQQHAYAVNNAGYNYTKASDANTTTVVE